MSEGFIQSRVYLVGPISGCTYEEATNWRRLVTEVLKAKNHLVFDPMSGKEELKQEEKIVLAYEEHLMAKADHIFLADLHRVRQSDVLFCNLLDIKGFTVGSLFEIGFGYALNKAIIVIANDKMITDHPFIKNSAFVASSVEEGLTILDRIMK